MLDKWAWQCVGSKGVGKDNASSFENLILMDISVTVHQRNLQLLMIEIYKTRNDLNPSFMRQIFEEKVLPYNQRCSDKLQLPKAKATGLGIDTVRFVGDTSMGGRQVWEGDKYGRETSMGGRRYHQN